MSKLKVFARYKYYFDFQIQFEDLTQLGRRTIPIKGDAAPPGATLIMLTKTHFDTVKQFYVYHTDNENCNNGLQISKSRTIENQMCVRILFQQYLEIRGDSDEAASSNSGTATIEKVCIHGEK